MQICCDCWYKATRITTENTYCKGVFIQRIYQKCESLQDLGLQYATCCCGLKAVSSERNYGARELK